METSSPANPAAGERAVYPREGRLDRADAALRDARVEAVSAAAVSARKQVLHELRQSAEKAGGAVPPR